jgi:cytidylate kinase
MNVKNLSLSVAEALLRTQRSAGNSFHGGVSNRAHAVIAISREVGASGETVAQAVGRQLGCPVYGGELVDKVAEELRQPAAVLKRLDERPTFWVEDWVSGFSGQTFVSADTYVRYLIATIRGIAEMGRCVMVGRGATRILPAEHTLRVRLIGERADRIKRVQQIRQLGDRDAADWLDRTQHERLEFIRQNFGADPADPHRYDVLLNTSRLSVADCADIIVHAFGHLEAVVRGRAPQAQSTSEPEGSATARLGRR